MRYRKSRLDAICLASVIVFAAVIFLPPVYVLSYATRAFQAINAESIAALEHSFAIAFIVTIVNTLLGLPAAWVIARRKTLPHRLLIDTLLDMPLVVPTSVLGLSVYYFWGGGLGSLLGVSGGLVGKGPILIALLHIVFTFPYIVRSIEAAIRQIDISHEEAATMLGASPLTVYRTISLPLFKAGLISGAILVFTRSLSETGATMMVAGLYSTAPTLVVAYKKTQDLESAAAVSVILIVSAALLLIMAKLFSAKARVPVVRVWPGMERLLSRRYVPHRDAALALAVLAVILLPTFHIVSSGAGSVGASNIALLLSDREIINGIIVSFMLGVAVTGVNLALAIPVSLVISKNMFRIGTLVDAMNDVILLVPTSALGLSLSLYWQPFHLNEFLVLALAHLSFTFPLMVKPLAAAVGAVDTNLEDAARTLGARQTTVFRTVLYPLVKPAITAGVIMTFMRSLSETGATLSVSENIKTIPVLLVERFTAGRVGDETILACILLFAISFAFILAIKRMGRAKDVLG